MKAVSLWQPWAQLLAAGEKKIETRSWKFPGPLPCVLAVHATRVEPASVREMLAAEAGGPFLEALGRITEYEAGGFWHLPRGVVVGLVRVAECHATRFLSLQALSDRERAFGDFRDYRFGWVCDRFHVFDAPPPCRGRQGVFNWSPPADLQLPGWAREEA